MTLGFEGRRILVVEDNADTCRVMEKLLTRVGYGVRTADGVASALQASQNERFDLVISDIGLPDGSGLDLIQQLLARGPVKGIALTGYGMDEDIQKSRDAGFHEHLTKPIDLQKLESTIRRLFEE